MSSPDYRRNNAAVAALAPGAGAAPVRTASCFGPEGASFSVISSSRDDFPGTIGYPLSPPPHTALCSETYVTLEKERHAVCWHLITFRTKTFNRAGKSFKSEPRTLSESIISMSIPPILMRGAYQRGTGELGTATRYWQYSCTSRGNSTTSTVGQLDKYIVLC